MADLDFNSLPDIQPQGRKAPPTLDFNSLPDLKPQGGKAVPTLDFNSLPDLPKSSARAPVGAAGVAPAGSDRLQPAGADQKKSLPLPPGPNDPVGKIQYESPADRDARVKKTAEGDTPGSILEGVKEGAKEGFGDQPLNQGPASDFAAWVAGKVGADPAKARGSFLGAGLDTIGRGINAGIGAGAGAIGNAAAQAGLADQGMTQRLKRDAGIIGQGALIEGAPEAVKDKLAGAIDKAMSPRLGKPETVTPRGSGGATDGDRPPASEITGGKPAKPDGLVVNVPPKRLPDQPKAPLPNEAKLPAPGGAPTKEQPDHVRFYHGGSDPTSGGGRWVTRDPEYARNFRAGNTPKEVHYVDIPKNDPTEVSARHWDEIDEQSKTNQVGRYKDIELPEKWAKQLRPYAGRDINSINYNPAFEAAMDKALPKELSSGASAPQGALSEKPSSKTVGNQSDRFFRIQQQGQADKTQIKQAIDAMPDEIKTPELQEKFYRYMEGDGKLTPDEQALYDRTMEPLKKEEAELYDKATQYGVEPEDINRDYVHRMVQGENPQFDQFSNAGQVDPVLTGQYFSGGKLPQSTSSLKQRVFHAIEDADGSRQLVAIKDGKLQVIENDSAKPVSVRFEPGSDTDELKPGARIIVDGKPHTIVQARTSEIEANTKLRYYKNALANTADNVVRLRSVVRSMAEMKRLTESPEWAAYARPHNDTRAPRNWLVPDMPLFRDWKVEPNLAHAINDFYANRYKDGYSEALAKINALAVRSLFWTPIPHIMNVGVHWGVGRGWDWLNPLGYPRFVSTTMRAIKEVVTQGPKMQEMMREGSAMIYPGIANKDFYKQLLGRAGMDMRQRPENWKEVAKAVGLSPVKLAETFYNAMSKVLWGANDMFLLQRTLELEAKGHASRKAILEAEKHIPNYRIPTKVLGSRMIQKALTNPITTEFSRYHYGIFKSYAHMLNDLFKKNATGKERFDAIGNMMALGVLGFYIYPALDNGLQQLLGNPDARVTRRGAMSFPDQLTKLYNGDMTIPQIISNVFTLSPVLKEGAEQLFNTDMFTGRSITPPGEKGIGRNVATKGAHALETLVSPLNTVAQGVKTQQEGESVPASVGKSILRQTLGYSDPTQDQRSAKARALAYQKKDALRARAKPKSNPLEDAMDKAMRAIGVEQ